VPAHRTCSPSDFLKQVSGFSPATFLPSVSKLAVLILRSECSVPLQLAGSHAVLGFGADIFVVLFQLPP
jgi:hypothetical protein